MSREKAETERTMPFIIAATNSAGAIAVPRHTAREALDKVLEFESGGYQKITVKDDLGRSLTREQLAQIVIGQG